MRKFFRAMTLTALTLLAMIYVARKADAPRPVRESCEVGAVLSGDSLMLNCRNTGQVQVKISGINAPDIAAPGCAEELAHGTLAMERLQSLIKSGAVHLGRLEGGYSPPRIRLSIDGADVADRLIREGLAVAYDGGTLLNWCERLGAQ